MKRVSAADVVRRFSILSDEALLEPMVVTRNGRDRLVVVNVDFFQEVLAKAFESASEAPFDLRLGALLTELRHNK